MKVTIVPSKAVGHVCAPPSKSLAHRALIAGALSVGSTVSRLAWSQDITATLSCLQAMGAAVQRQGDIVHIGGLNPLELPPGAVLHCNESGSTLRFLLPLCMLANRPITLTGSRRLMERPLGVYEMICEQQGISLTRGGSSITVCGRLNPGCYRVPGDVSSQFITGLLYALPLLTGESRLKVVGRFESASYIDLTLSVLQAFGIRIQRQGSMFYIPGGQTYSPADYAVEGDCSNAAFLEALNCIGGSVKVDGITPETLQGDRVYREMFRALAAGERQFDLSDCPDLAPVLFAMSAALGAGARFTGTARLRIKESDRGVAMAQELAKFGIRVSVEENAVEVLPGVLQPPSEELYGHNDHRIVMALSLLCTITGGTVNGAEAVAKSYPDFFEVLNSLQIGLSLYET